MKKKYSILLILLTLTIILSAGVVAYGAITSSDGYTIDTPYAYPLEPGTDDWFAIEDHSIKVELLQVPENILTKLTTQALVETVVSYPYLNDMHYFSTPELGYTSVRDHFNGLQELERRPDGMETLLAYYRAEMSRRSEYTLALASVEIILLESGHTIELASQDEFSFARCLYSEDEFSARVAYPRTPSGKSVTQSWCHYNQEDMADIMKELYADDARGKYGLEPLRPATLKYNCHSYAWYNQAESNLWWIDYPDDFIHDSYYMLNNGTIQAGNIAVYKQSASSTTYLHSAIVTYVSDHGSIALPKPPINVISKWGPAGLYAHNIYNCPDAYGRNITFYKAS